MYLISNFIYYVEQQFEMCNEMCSAFPCNAFVYSFRGIRIFDEVCCGGFIMIKIQQLLSSLYTCTFKYVNKISACKVYIFNNKNILHAQYHAIVQ